MKKYNVGDVCWFIGIFDGAKEYYLDEGTIVAINDFIVKVHKLNTKQEFIVCPENLFDNSAAALVGMLNMASNKNVH